MINNARGSHVSPGIYTKEVDVTYAPKSLGITTLGLAGETLKGPAFQPVSINSWSEFVDYFGGTSAEKIGKADGEKQVKYELPYIAKEYLKESNQLEVTRVLGFSGYNAGAMYGIIANITDKAPSEDASEVKAKTAKADEAKTPVVKTVKASAERSVLVGVLRERAKYSGDTPVKSKCTSASGDAAAFKVTGVTMSALTKNEYTTACADGTISGKTVDSDAREVRITVKFDGSPKNDKTYDVSLNSSKKNFILNVFGDNPECGSSELYVEEIYENYIDELLTDEKNKDKNISFEVRRYAEKQYSDYKECFRSARTPWIVSEARGEGNNFNVKRLFRFHTITDGNASNSAVKISISNIMPDSGLFDVNIRNFYDTDFNPEYLERFSKCSMDPSSENYIALKMGTSDGTFELKSKYVLLELSENEGTEHSIPCGFLGYPVQKIDDVETSGIKYNVSYDINKKSKRQFFGMSNISGIDSDLFKYKGTYCYEEKEDNKGSFEYIKLTSGFHLDERINKSVSGTEIFVDDIKIGSDSPISKFETVNSRGLGVNKSSATLSDEASANMTIYEDKDLRKFTVYPYGGFDGWDVFRGYRTNGNEFNEKKYNGTTYSGTTFPEGINLPGMKNTSDYYAYLAGYKTFANPEEVDINLFATPGIDWKNNEMLVKDAIDIIEDFDEGRGGDAFYIINSPEKIYKDEDVKNNAESIVADLKETGIDTSYAGTYWPWVRCYDSAEKAYVDLPVTKDIVRNMAYIDNNYYPWMAPAGVTEKGKVDCVRASYTTRCNEEDILYEGRINPVKTFAVDGVKVWGNKTLYSVNSPLNRVNVRRLMIRLKKEISNSCRSLIFEPNDMTVRNQFLSIVNPILENVRNNRGITDYKVVVDNSPEAMDQHVLPAKIWIKPTPTLEYIDLTFVITPQGGSFTD